MEIKLMSNNESFEVSDYIGFCLYNEIAIIVKKHNQLFEKLSELYGVQEASEEKEIRDLEDSIINNIALTIDKKKLTQ